MHEKDAHLIELELDDQALDARIEIMKSLPGNARCSEQGVGLLAHDGYQMIDRAGAVLALVSRIVTYGIGDIGGLIQHAGAHRADIDLDQADQIGILGADEGGDLLEHSPAAAQIAGSGQGQVERGPGTGRIAYVVDE